MNQMTITGHDGKMVNYRDVNQFDFQGNYLIMQFADMKTRKVISLADIDVYEYKGQPIVVNTPPKKSKSSKKK